MPTAPHPEATQTALRGVVDGVIGWCGAPAGESQAQMDGFIPRADSSDGPLSPGEPVHTCSTGPPMWTGRGWRCPD